MSGIFGFHIEDKEQNSILDCTKKMRLWNEAYGNCEAEIFQGKEYVCGCCADTVLHENMKNKPILHKNGKVAVLDVILYNAKELMEEPKKFSAWFLIAAPKVLKWLKENH